MLFDTHAHLNDERLYPLADEIVGDMERDGLVALVNVGYDMPSSELSVELANKFEKVFGAVGIHPHDSKTATRECYDRFKSVATNEKIVAVGEIGLDFYYDLSDRETQARVFVEQMELAYALKKPMILHIRDAYGLALSIMKENASKLYYGAVLHCYGGSRESVREFSKFDAYYSFGGALTFKNATDKPDVVRQIPIDRLLLETDCPYMTPVPYRGKPNFPKYIGLVADRAAEILGTERAEIERITTENAMRFFRIGALPR